MNYVEFFNNYGKDLDINLVALKDFIIYCLDRLSLKNVLCNVIVLVYGINFDN